MLKKMLKKIDNFLNKITMYKLVLYFLILLIVIAIGFGSIGLLPYNPIALLFSALFITTLCLVVNIVFAWVFKAPTNAESVYITALILVLIITPISSPHDTQFFSLAIWASVWAMASKYIFAIQRKHIFNPAAFAVALTALTINQSASWWVGTLCMAPFVLIGGLLLTRKILRFDLVISFFVVAAVVTLGSQDTGLVSLLSNFWTLLAATPLFFFAFVMLTEPLTTPPRRWLRILYGGLVGFLFAPSIHIGSLYSTPELALIAGNIFSYLVSPKQKLMLELTNRIAVAGDVYDFLFMATQKLKFKPGQYLEWTLDRSGVDSRGNRRYFTIASSPTEEEIIIGIKFYPKPSSFKRHLLEMKGGDMLVASQLAGDFVMPRNKKKKLVFIAGGIGITPFRSMIKYLLDKGEKRDIVLFYSNRTAADVVYEEIFNEASDKLGIKTVYAITDPKSPGYSGAINDHMITSEAPDYEERYFYISGPHAMVVGFQQTLKDLGVRKSHMKTDFFPGFA
jgi:ferredoxin-NADP reductase